MTKRFFKIYQKSKEIIIQNNNQDVWNFFSKHDIFKYIPDDDTILSLEEKLLLKQEKKLKHYLKANATVFIHKIKCMLRG